MAANEGAGFTLIEMTVTLALAGLTFIAVSSLTVMTSNYEISSEGTMARDALLNQLMTYVSNASAITRSMNADFSGNTAFLNCLCGGGGTCNTQTLGAGASAMGSVDFPLFAPNPAQTSSITNEIPVTGASALPSPRPVYYDFRGAPYYPTSAAPQVTSAFTATTSLRFQCPATPQGPFTPNSTCLPGQQAELMQITVTVAPISPGQMQTVQARRVYDLSILYPSGSSCP